MTKQIILVTGATGNTGSSVVEQLLQRGYPVRAFVHRLDDRSQRLSELGADVVVGDFHDLDSLRNAMKGFVRCTGEKTGNPGTRNRELKHLVQGDRMINETQNKQQRRGRER